MGVVYHVTPPLTHPIPPTGGKTLIKAKYCQWKSRETVDGASKKTSETTISSRSCCRWREQKPQQTNKQTNKQTKAFPVSHHPEQGTEQGLVWEDKNHHEEFGPKAETSELNHLNVCWMFKYWRRMLVQPRLNSLNSSLKHAVLFSDACLSSSVEAKWFSPAVRVLLWQKLYKVSSNGTQPQTHSYRKAVGVIFIFMYPYMGT